MNGKWNVKKDGKITIHEFYDNVIKRITIKVIQNNLEEKQVFHVFCLRYDQGEEFVLLGKHDDLEDVMCGLESIAETYNRTTTMIVCGVDDLRLNKSDTVYLVLDERNLKKGDLLHCDFITYYLTVEEKIQEMITGSLYKLNCEKVFDVDRIRSGKVLQIKRS